MKGAFRENRSLLPFVVLSRDSRGRSLAKTVVYRVWAIALLAAISYYFTGNAGEATTITILFNAGGTLAYYGLERLWAYLDWGKSASGSAPTRPSALSLGLGIAADSEDSKITAVSNGLKNEAS
jgi:uncharacterized membrane protein